MSGLFIGYARVSTEEQDLTAERNGLTELGVDRLRDRRPAHQHFVAAATASYLRHHGNGPASQLSATVHGFTIGYWWAAAVYLGAALVCGALIRPHADLHHPAADESLVEAQFAVPA